MDSDNQKNIYQPDSFSFTYNFQVEILVACVQSLDFFIKIYSSIIPAHFETNALKIFYGSIIRFYKKYNNIPDKIKLIEFIPDKLKSTDILELINIIYEYRILQIFEIEFITDNVILFAKHQAMKFAVIDSMDKLSDPEKYEEIKKNVEDALMVGFNINDLGVHGYNIEEVEKRFKDRNDVHRKNRVSLGFSELDKVMDGGMLGGELCSFLGPAKGSKTMVLVNIGSNILLAKKNILFITLEMSEDKILERFDMRMSGMTKEEIRLPEALKKLQDIHNNVGDIIIKSFPTNSLTNIQLEMYLTKLRMSSNFIPDIVLLDYAELMAPDTKYTNKRFDIDNIYYGLAGLATKLNLPIITVTQATRDAVKRLSSGDTIDKSDVAESFGISRVISYLISINTESNIANKTNSIELYVAANRYGPDGIKFKLYADLSRCMIRDLVDTDNKNRLSHINQ